MGENIEESLGVLKEFLDTFHGFSKPSVEIENHKKIVEKFLDNCKTYGRLKLLSMLFAVLFIDIIAFVLIFHQYRILEELSTIHFLIETSSILVSIVLALLFPLLYIFSEKEKEKIAIDYSIEFSKFKNVFKEAKKIKKDV